MSDDLQLLMLCILAVYEIYTVRMHDSPVMARFWDLIASITGAIANFFARLAVHARLAYWEAVQI